MMRYHLGWADERLDPTDAPTGKRLRPLIAILVAEACGAPGTHVLPIAVSLELLHNFTLVHDDVEDGDATRHHRPTLWALWGPPQAINAGDGMHVIAHLALLAASEAGVAPEVVVALARRFAVASLFITEGQHLDLAFTGSKNVSVGAYLDMIARKSAALIACSAAMGAEVARATPTVVDSMQAFGHALGLGFQVRDDVLGMWGNPSVTGKPTSDLARRKKTLPTLYALGRVSDAERRVIHGFLGSEATSDATLEAAQTIINRSGARRHCEALVGRYSREARRHLEALSRCDARDALGELVAMLEVRDR
jgi:geranylgeranyl diphosphate synthase type I